MFPAVRGFSPIPRKMSGSAINTMDWLMKTMRVPRVMANRATHLYLGRLVRGGEAPFVPTGRSAFPVAVVLVTPESITLTSG